MTDCTSGKSTRCGWATHAPTPAWRPRSERGGLPQPQPAAGRRSRCAGRSTIPVKSFMRDCYTIETSGRVAAIDKAPALQCAEHCGLPLLKGILLAGFWEGEGHRLLSVTQPVAGA